ncbi:TIGR01777 family oxidoreductase [Roseivirga sp. BDSF3-8]|uniref:TIGR01777 family oxidoreductase n=1 Tax=Roseivirga sp. BDSF3-8 TaxID=3241598 RepID=UPI00353265BA
MPKNVLITGGTGLVGHHLTLLLISKGYHVAHLSRSPSPDSSITTYLWDIDKGYIQREALDFADYIIHLAGAGVADKKWTDSRKKVIMNSRTQSTRLLFDTISQGGYPLQRFVSASAIGYYGMDTGDKWITEESGHGTDFLADVTSRWEEEVKKFHQIDVPEVRIRIGVVLAEEGGALPKMAKPVRFGLGAPLGDGSQYVSWIHIQDLCGILAHALTSNRMENQPYNAVAPYPVTNKELTKQIGKALRKPVFLPSVPAFMLKMVLGEMSQIVLGGNRVSSEKIRHTGFDFSYPHVDQALKDLL